MAGTQLAGEVFNAREVDVSGDLMRNERLNSREILNLLRDLTMGPNVPRSSALGPMTLTAVAATFKMTIAASQVLGYDPTDPDLTADDSPMKLARWAQQDLTFATPDAANPRIDLVVATPAMVSSDPATRNILIDPNTRTFAPQTVNKTISPVATLSIVTGTPGVTPVPGAVPSRGIALFEVLVPPTVADATSFRYVPRIFRPTLAPDATMSGIVAGMELNWDLTVDPSAASAGIFLGDASHLAQKVLIDGELLEFTSGGTGTGAGAIFSQDAGGNNPFAAAAPAGNDKPYYIYAVGGRHSPQGVWLPNQQVFSPVAIVESLVAPDPNNQWRPSSAIQPPRGGTTVDGAIYIGLGFVVNNSTRRRACLFANDITYCGVESKSHAMAAGPGPEAIAAPASKPAISTCALVTLRVTANAICQAYVLPDDGSGTQPAQAFVLAVNGSAKGNVNLSLEVANQTTWRDGVLTYPLKGGPSLQAWITGPPTGATCVLEFRGWNTKAPRIRGLA